MTILSAYPILKTLSEHVSSLLGAQGVPLQRQSRLLVQQMQVPLTELPGLSCSPAQAVPLATGIKLMQPEQSVWILAEDAAVLSPAAQLALQRNLDIKLVMCRRLEPGLARSGAAGARFASPRLDARPSALAMALGAGACFLARTLLSDPEHLRQTLERAAGHTGAAVVEVLLPVADEAYSWLRLEHGRPMVFDAAQRGIRLNGIAPEKVVIGENGISEADLLVHDETGLEPTLAYFLTRLQAPEFPLPLGVFRAVPAKTYNEQLQQQLEDQRHKKGNGELRKLLFAGDTWEVNGETHA